MGEHTLPKISFPTLGPQVIMWMEEYLTHGPGDIQGEPLHLDDEECLFLCWAYRVHPKGHPRAGRRLVHRGIYIRSKGQRKSEIGGAIGCAELLGPVRCDGFDASGEPVGRPVVSPFVRVLATEEEQSTIVFDNIVYMLTHGRASDEYELDIGRSFQTSTRIYIPGGGEVRPSTSGDASKDGGKESCVIADEGHLMTSTALRNMYRTVARNTAKRIKSDPWMFEPTTVWQPGEHSVIEDAYDKYAHLPTEDAVVKHGVLIDHRRGKAPAVFNSDASLTKALRTAYHEQKHDWTDFEKVVRLIRDSEDPEADAYRYFLSIPRPTSTQWIDPHEMQDTFAPVDVDLGDPIAMGFDGSEADDHTALMGCTRDGDLFTIGVWVPSGEPRWREDVEAAVEWAMAAYRVVRFYSDPAWWTAEVARWTAKYGAPPVYEFWTGQRNESKLAVATGALRTAIRRAPEAGRIKIDPNPRYTEQITMAGRPIVQWHFENARCRVRRVRIDDRTEDMYIVRKEAPSSKLKIDSVVATILARRARDDAFKAGEFANKPRGVFSW